MKDLLDNYRAYKKYLADSSFKETVNVYVHNNKEYFAPVSESDRDLGIDPNYKGKREITTTPQPTLDDFMKFISLKDAQSSIIENDLYEQLKDYMKLKHNFELLPIDKVKIKELIENAKIKFNNNFLLAESMMLLRELADLQNGSPLVEYEEEWNATMKASYNLLEKYEGGLK